MKSKQILLSTIFSLIFAIGCSNPSQITNQQIQSNVQSQNVKEVESPKLKLKILKAEVLITEEELNKQFNAILKLSNEKRISNTNISVLKDNILVTDGDIFIPNPLLKNKTIKIPFTLEGVLSAEKGNIIKFSATKIKVFKIESKKLMDFIGLELANIAKFKDKFGRIEQKGNSFLLIIQKFTNDVIIDGDVKQIKTDNKAIKAII